ncbi:MAG: glutamine-hydrolyzing GMP synthase [Bacillota bacterium]|nr:glutamine-hydrolyzing GMP synthase [Bacillota bacterium]
MSGIRNDSHDLILLLDFGAQYSQLIARRIRAEHVYCEIIPYDTPADKIAERRPRGIIFSGGPASVLDADAPYCDPGVFELGLPILGICYGMQLMTVMLGGEVISPSEREYGKVDVSVDDGGLLLRGMDKVTQAWMSHMLQVKAAPPGFRAVAHTRHCACAAFENTVRGCYGVQFHPEVTHTPQGRQVFQNFLFAVCGCAGDWLMSSYAEQAVEAIRRQVGDKQVLLGLSGGVDSSVAAALLHRAVGERLTAVCVNHGLMRKNEPEQVEAVFRPRLGDKLIMVDAARRFLHKLAGVSDPETKRKIIGAEFIEVFADTARSLDKLDFLAQGTIYPDIVESGSATGMVIKSHHNVGGLPERLPFCGIVEPLRPLFKDEVRALGLELGLPEDMVWRPPFPGPGLAIRIIGDITEDKLRIVRDSDEILRQEIAASELGRAASQYFTVLTGLRSVGVMGDERSYDYTVAVRAVSTDDFMTADWLRIPFEVLDKISRRIVNEVRQVNRIVYDITSKPPASIEWE